MKKIFLLAALFAASTVVFVSCSKDDSDQGEKDGKAYCDCLKKADESSDPFAGLECISILSKAKDSKDYAKGFEKGTKGCANLLDD